MYIQHMLIQKTGVFTINVFSQTLSPFYILIYFDEHFFFAMCFMNSIIPLRHFGFRLLFGC